LKHVRLFLFLALALFCGELWAQGIPSNTRLAVRLDATVSSATAQVGDIVAATLANDLVVDGKVLAKRGTPVRGIVTYARRSGRFQDPGYVTVRLHSIDIDGRRYRLHSTAIRDEGNGHTRSNVEKIGGGTGIGALIGGLAGGGKGALIGGLLGAGAGTGVAAATGRQKAELPAEAVYEFRLTSAATPQNG
jgi:hypothetical protein